MKFHAIAMPGVLALVFVSGLVLATGSRARRDRRLALLLALEGTVHADGISRLHKETLMIVKLTHATVYVLDQDRAKAFYTDKLGFEVRDDARMGDFRWLTVGPKTQPDVRIILMPVKGPATSPEATAALRAAVASGALGGGVLECEDILSTYEDLRARGVEFPSPPKQMPYGLAAVFKDDSGNYFSLSEVERRK